MADHDTVQPSGPFSLARSATSMSEFAPADHDGPASAADAVRRGLSLDVDARALPDVGRRDPSSSCSAVR